ncbi:hypothetical protein GCM10010274_23200 [Streptomyces lavendofoliae]|uniref:Uncharacterized protein n=1 Tax=Streptomyces lavendofoliae TaxID=67314 RepID=A0A918M454_9ACTN|nr:hypothetical protein GCM10010274_23200 [Streptomyces lavendofoliae]
MSSNAYALRPRLPRPISISVTMCGLSLYVCAYQYPRHARGGRFRPDAGTAPHARVRYFLL